MPWSTSRSAPSRAVISSPWSGPHYRIVKPAYSDVDNLTNGEGAHKWGSRWNWSGLDRVVFGATEPRGAFAEWERYSKIGGAPFDPDSFNRDMRSFSVELQGVLDLISPEALQALGLTDLLAIDWMTESICGREALTHAVGRAVHSLGIEAMRVPCAPLPQTSHIVIFRSRLSPASKVPA